MAIRQNGLEFTGLALLGTPYVLDLVASGNGARVDIVNEKGDVLVRFAIEMDGNHAVARAYPGNKLADAIQQPHSIYYDVDTGEQVGTLVGEDEDHRHPPS